MNYIVLSTVISAAILIGAGIASIGANLFYRQRLKVELSAARDDLTVENATLRERVEARDGDVRALKASAAAHESEAQRLRESLSTEQQARAAADAQIPRIALLENVLKQRDEALEAVRVDLGTEQQSRAGAEARAEAIGELEHRIKQRTELLESIRKELSVEQRSRATAEAKIPRISELEVLLGKRDEGLSVLRSENEILKTTLAELQTKSDEERKATNEKLALIDEAKKNLSDAFKALSAEALKNNNQSFIELASSTLAKFQEMAKGDLEKRQQAIDLLVKPVGESLQQFDKQIREIEKDRIGSYESLRQQLGSLAESQNMLRSETTNLVKALRQPGSRGRWGEMQLRRVVEMAGMIDHVDFFEQQSELGEGGVLRPDMIVRLPGDKTIVIDAKAPLSAYLSAIEATDEATRLSLLVDHAAQVRNHISQLSKKSYWEQFQPTPEIVVMFLPGENFYGAALEQDPTLIEVGVKEKILLATPTTLIGLLRAVSYGWRQEAITEHVEKISALGQELYKRLSTLGEHMSKLGKSLGLAVEAFNNAGRSLETRVFTTARKFKELQVAASSQEIDIVEPVGQMPREIQLPEFVALPGSHASTDGNAS
jgi:DNA recombination protein RmuC